MIFYVVTQKKIEHGHNKNSVMQYFTLLQISDRISQK